MENYSRIPPEYLEKFLLEFTHHSGLPYLNTLSVYYLGALQSIAISDNLSLDDVVEQFVNAAMQLCHRVYAHTKTWKSYDW